MGLSADARILSYRGLAELGLSTRLAWDIAADNLITSARRPAGTRFYLRTARIITGLDTTALQVRVPGAPVTAWLAHPRTFTILHRHLEQQLGATPVYLAPLEDLLIAFPADPPAPASLRNWAQTTMDARENSGERICAAPLTYQHGFPTEHPTASELVRSRAA